MNLVLFLVHLLLTSYAPTNQTTTSDDAGTTVNPGPGKDKGGKYNDGDYIIANDTHP
ncbi:MAG: hypothetical protein J0M29_04340 [Chitinophagales bacterium]|nr:hypothetical protein [Chitinophagales bacterium]